MDFDQFKRAIIAKTKDKSDMPEWYYKRLEKCMGCEFNSGNVDDLSFKDKLRISHNFGKDACLKCTCGVKDKSSDPQESCPENIWGKEEESLSNHLNIVMKINHAELTFNEKLNKYIVDYGIIPHKFDSNVELIILDKNIEGIKVATSCGCTTAQPKKIDEGTQLIVRYDTVRIGKFEKAIKLTYRQNDIMKQTIINIKGTVKK